MIKVAVSGGFDPIHMGHIRLIQAASRLGDYLIVIVNSDDFLMRKKGYIFMPIEERMEILQAIRGVNEVVVAIDEDDTICKTLKMIRPQIFANGGDRTMGDSREMKVCRQIDCKDVYGVGGEKIQSSSKLVRRKYG